MDTSGTIIGIVGSPNPDGRTNRLVSAAIRGAADAGARTEIIQLSEHVPEACRDCLPWVCKDNLKCTYEDEAFVYVSRKLLDASGLIFGSPVYFWDTSAMVRAFILKMFRLYGMSAPLNGLPAFGLAVAGGTGNGLVSGLRPLYHFFQIMRMRAIDPLPATRFNFSDALKTASQSGARIAQMAREREPFALREDVFARFDALPYLGMTIAAERRLLAYLAALAASEEGLSVDVLGLARADVLAAAGRSRESLMEVTRVYEAGAGVLKSR